MGKEALEPEVLGWVVADSEDRRPLRGNMPLAISRVETARRSSDQNEPADQFRTVEGDLLRDHAAEGKPEKVDLLQPHSIDDGFCIPLHACKGGGNLSGGDVPVIRQTPGLGLSSGSPGGERRSLSPDRAGP